MARSLAFARALFFSIVLMLPAATYAAPPQQPSSTRTKQSLKTKIPVDYDWQPLGEVLADIGKRIGVPVELDIQALHAEGVTPETPVRLQVATEISAHSTLELILQQLRLVYRVGKDGTITVGGPPVASDFEEVIYDLEGLVLPGPHFHPPATKEPAQHSQKLTQQVVDLLVDTIRPDTWKDHGGEGTCTIVENRNSIVVWHDRAVQAEVRDLIEQLYRLKSVQVHFKVELVEVARDDWQRLPQFENSQELAKVSLLRHSTPTDDDKAVDLKVLSTRQLLAYNGEELTLATKAKRGDEQLVRQLLVQPVVTADHERIRLAVVDDRGRKDADNERRREVTLEDGESVLIPLSASAWNGEKADATVPCYRLTARICVFFKDGSSHVTIAP